MLLVDKPAGPTSHDVVGAVRRALGQKRVGHAGTLDPSASGLLVVLVGRATRLARFIAMLPKRYVGTVRFGWETSTDDAEGEPTLRDDRWIALDLPGAKSRAEVEAALAGVAARAEQLPPAVSAKKIAGERAYRRARRGEDVRLRPVPVRIHRLTIREPQDWGGDLPIEVECSSGTYVRAIARDIGRELQTRAHLAGLRRTGIGPWDVREAVALDGALAASARGMLRPMREAVAHLPALELGPDDAARLVHGQKLAATGAGGAGGAGGPGLEHRGPVAVFGAGELIAVAEARGDVLAPDVVLGP